MPKPLLLLVDDSPEMGTIVSSLGRRAGCDVALAAEAVAAWEALVQRRPDLVLLDVNLPGPSGLDWLRGVRAAPQYAGVPIALYTHWGLPADVAAGVDAGVDFVFDKDLATRPADWQRRLSEIRAASPDAWPKVDAAPTMGGEGADTRLTTARVEALNQLLQHASVRRMPREVMRSVLRRALTRTFASGISARGRDAWIAPGEARLIADRLPPPFAPDSPLLLAVCLAELMRRLLGNEAGAAFGDALTAAFPNISKRASWS